MPTGALGQEKQFRNMVVELDGVASEVTAATATAGAATCSDYIGLITTEALTTAQNALYTLVITNTKVAAGDLCFVTVGNGTNTAGTPVLTKVTTTANTITLLVANLHASAVAFNGTLKIGFMLVKVL